MMPTRFLLVAVTFSLAILLYVDRICISTAKDPMIEELGLTDTQFGWILSAFALGYALFQTPCGVLADHFGPRRILSSIVALWSLLTGLTGAVSGFLSMLVVRFLFGAGEAGAFPGVARVVYSWIPMKERGTVQGINFSGGRLGAAFALPAVAWMVEVFGWRTSFGILMLIGFVWAVGWWRWFRDEPADHPGVSAAECEFILNNRQQTRADGPHAHALTAADLLSSGNMWLVMTQYFCSNFTFFFCLTWLFPHLKKMYGLDSVEAGWYASAPLIFGALGNIASGWLVDGIYRSGSWRMSRQFPAILGFLLAATGLVASLYMQTALGAIAWLSVAIFGADMTLSPSWSFCIDIGGRHAGAVSGTMNMAGNIGSFVTSLAFPYLQVWTGDVKYFFYVGAGLNVVAVFVWCFMRPEKPIRETASS